MSLGGKIEANQKQTLNCKKQTGLLEGKWARGRARWVKGVKKGICRDENCVLCVSDESLNSIHELILHCMLTNWNLNLNSKGKKRSKGKNKTEREGGREGGRGKSRNRLLTIEKELMVTRGRWLGGGVK